MKLRNRLERVSSLALLFALPVALPGVLTSAPAQSQAATGSPSTAPDAATAAKAAARKKKFEEEKARLEGTQRPVEDECKSGKPVLYITPTTASMLVGESRRFAAFDTSGKKLTAVADWSIVGSSHATLTKGAEPTVTATSEGEFSVTATLDSRTAEARVKVYPGNQLPIGTTQWTLAPVPCSKGAITQVVQAVPH